MLEDRTLQNGFVIGMFQFSDAEGIVECYREAYGDQFPMQYVYDPGEILRRNAGSTQHTLVLRTGEGMVAGLVSIFSIGSDHGIYEIGQLIIRRQYRHLKLGRNLSGTCFNEMTLQVGARVLVGEAVCNAVASQKLGLEGGLAPTGLELECLPGEKEARTSLLYMFRVFRDQPHTLFVPGKYADFVRSCCDRLKLTRHFDTGAPPRDACSEVNLESLAFAQLIRYRVRRPGRDLESRLEKVLSDHPAWNVQVQVCLADPAAPWAVQVLQKRGFFLGAYLPLWMRADALMLQHLPRKPQLDAICLIPGAAGAVMDEVRADLESCRKDLSA